jgi:hypothetical protein
MSSFMSDPEITENVIDNSEEYTLKNRIDTDKVFKKRPVQGKVTTETPDVIMPVVEEVREPIVEEQVVEEESGGANFIYEDHRAERPVETVKPQKKAKRKMTEKQLEALKRGREKSLATRQAKKNVKKSINIAPEQPRQLGHVEQESELQYRPQTPIQPRPQTPIQPQYVKKDELKNAMIEAISTYDGIRKTRKEEKKKAEKTATEAQKLTAVIQKALNPSQDEYFATCFNIT